MKLNVQMKALVINKKSQKSEKNGNTYYSMNIATADDAGRVSITEDVFNFIESMKEYEFLGEYNDIYKSFRVTGLIGKADK